MAPEQVEGQPADERTDLWALGLILYVSPDGQRFLFAQYSAPPQEPIPLVVVINWFDELKAKMREAGE